MRKQMMAGAAALLVGGLTAMPAAEAANGDTLKAVKERGTLLCTGHNGSYLGFAEVDDEGKWHGFDIDLCRAFAMAIFGTEYEDHLKIVPIGWAQRFPSLQSGDIDVIIKATGWTYNRDTDLGVQFSRPYLLAPARVMTRKDLGAESIADLEGGTICVPAGTTIERYVVEYAAAKDLDIEFLPIEKTEETDAAYLSGRCDGYGQWDVVLATVRLKADDPDAHVILPDVMNVEPIAMGMRSGDDNFVDIANWLLNAFWMAEVNGITADNVDEMKADPPNPGVAKLLGVTPGIGSQLGLEDDWAYNVIKAFGNFNDIWERNVGMDSPYKLDRGINSTYKDGGLFYPLVLD
ncbi:transporter substrate-binding domain-containing protein [Acuticoccus mangrovi]|uniref:Transporter substrate-binding domain-containing protein n=1 Tax=Acuticoccus mangrovi TaxID=2796142 RepID=A0A934MKM6_9HYPH|nr:transporter substrate-binding domain-containing protein [Acuticoccus mangrovi]MBJ3775604.1 transporter substrate-binding domain-containing protein [Acuticoccus mangrovi]